MRSYTDRVWSDEARAELQAKIEHLTEDDLRRLLLMVISEANPDYLISTLRGAAFGLAARRGAAPALETTADATRVAEMTKRMNDLERERDAALEREQDLLAAAEQAWRALLERTPHSVPGGEQACEALHAAIVKSIRK